jgi:hypothetical protein
MARDPASITKTRTITGKSSKTYRYSDREEVSCDGKTRFPPSEPNPVVGSAGIS